MSLIRIHVDDKSVSHYLYSMGYALWGYAWCGTASVITGATLPFVTCLACSRIHDLTSGWRRK